MKHPILRVARKEWASLFGSPTAYIFLGSFLAVTLFAFFWVDTFFARNLADIRPLFEWMPVLLIFLMSAVTMRMWSEERRMGTLEFLLTLPVKTSSLVLGKFLACWVLAITALSLTLPLPITVSFMGPLDWGPVIGGYMAAVFLAAAYAAIGLYISSKTDSQIVSLILSVLAGAAFYVVGSDLLTAFVGNRGSELLKLMGTGSRFESITRGVLDIRDIYYYVSLSAVFLALNAFSLETLRWSKEKARPSHKAALLTTVLLCANFLVANLWLKPVSVLRADMTQGNVYSISPATKGVLSQLREPLLIRGYFSAKTHPLLAPLVPRLRDLIREYETVSGGRVRGEFIDPMEKPELEKEAAEKFGIKPVPFQVSDKYQAGLVNSYFNILVRYGDRHEVLGFDSLIDVKQENETKLTVELRNPEYDITRTIKKVLQGYQSEADLFATLQRPVTFTCYVSPDKDLPESLREFRAQMLGIVEEMKKEAGDRFTVVYQDPRAGDGSLAQELAKKFGIQPMRANLFDNKTFYFSLMLNDGKTAVMIPLPKDLNAVGVRQGIESGLKRFSAGFLKTVALLTAPNEPHYTPADGFAMKPEKTFDQLKEKLTQNHAVLPVELKDGLVPSEADLLFVAAPKEMDDKQVFALDQFLMKGGTVVLLTSPFSLKTNPLGATVRKTGLNDWLAHNGITVDSEMVLDTQNTPFPIPVERRVGPFVFQDLRMVNYPYFVDVRRDGLLGNIVTNGIPQMTIHWASPVQVDGEKNISRKVTDLLRSSPQSWTSGSLDVAPKINANLPLGFQPSGTTGSQRLGVTVEGTFESFFKGKESPLLPEEKKDPKDKTPEEVVFSSVIEKSAESARLVVIGSNDFLTDEILRFTSSVSRTPYLNTLQFAENVVDWALEDRGLLTIRGRGQFARVLNPMTRSKRMFWEYLNYGLALAGLTGLWGLMRIRRRRHLAQIPMILSERRA